MMILTTEDKKALNEIAKVIGDKNRFFLGTHIFPDGDNVGSMIAMKIILDELGKTSHLYCGTIVPRIYRWMEGTENISMNLPDEPSESFDVILTLDSADIGRLGPDFLSWYKPEKNMILNIDHHVTNTNYGDINWVSARHAATGEQIYELTDFLGLKVSQQMAVALFTAISTDCGRFSYSNTTAKRSGMEQSWLNWERIPILFIEMFTATNRFQH